MDLDVQGDLVTSNSLMFRNRIINGDMRIAQRGTSITSASAPYVYSLDRWRFYGQATTGSATVSQQAFTVGQTDVPGEPEFFMRWNQTATPGGTVALTQPVEGVRTLAGQSATVSFWAKAGSARSITVRLTQNFGSGGSADVSTNSSAQALTTSWQRYTITLSVPSISGKTIGANNYLDLMFVDSNASTFTTDIAEVQLEVGSKASAFERRPYSEELLRCQRYYEQISLRYFGAIYVAATTRFISTQPVFFKVTKRIAGSVYSIVTGSGTAYWADSASVFSATSNTGFNFSGDEFSMQYFQIRQAGGTTPGDNKFVFLESYPTVAVSAEL